MERKPISKKNAMLIALLCIVILPILAYAGIAFLLFGVGISGKGREMASDKENYAEYDVIVVNIKRAHARETEEEKEQDFFDDSFYFDVRYDSARDFARAKESETQSVGRAEISDTYTVIRANVAILKANGFFDDYRQGGILHVRASRFIYGDGMHYNIASVVYEGKEYLSFEEGLENIIQAYK